MDIQASKINYLSSGAIQNQIILHWSMNDAYKLGLSGPV